MKVLQLANGYLGSRLYQNLFSSQASLSIQNTIYVPVDQRTPVPEGLPEDVIVSGCFSQIDRVLFFRKQKKILCDLARHVKLPDYHLVHAHTLFSAGYAAMKLKEKHGIPYIVAVRNTDVNVFFKRMPHLRSTGVRVLREAETVVFLSPAYRETVVSQYVPEKYREEVRAKSVVIPNGIDSLFFENKGSGKTLGDGPLRLIYIGEITANKNLELTIEAVKRLIDTDIQVSLTVVGEIKDKSYRTLIEQTPFVEYHPRCPLKEVLEHLRKADIFVMPSHTETFGLVYAEAMSQGLPVLYTRGQGFDGQFPEGTVGYAVSDTDPQELAEKIKAVRDNYTELSGNCVQRVEQYDWALIAKRYDELYQRIRRGQK